MDNKDILVEQERIMKDMVASSDYINWLNNFPYGTKENGFQNAVFDIDFCEEYEASYDGTNPAMENGNKLYYFYESIKRYAYENDIPAFMAQDRDFYMVKHNNSFLGVGRIYFGNESSIYYCKKYNNAELSFLTDYDVNNKIVYFDKVLEANKEKIKAK